MLRTGYLFIYTGCPVLWWSRLHIEISISTTEAEHIALSQAMYNVIYFMVLMKDVSFKSNTHLPNPYFFVKSFNITKVALLSQNITKFRREQNTLLSSIIISSVL